MESEERKCSLAALARTFLWLGATSFGGPAAHIAIMEDELVTRRQWLTAQEFLDFIAAANLIPGPNSTEVAIHVGYRLRGTPGLLVSGISFILPAFLAVLALSSIYSDTGLAVRSAAMLSAARPVVLSVILQAVLRFSKEAVKSRTALLYVVLLTVLSYAGFSELLILFGSGIISVLAKYLSPVFREDKEERKSAHSVLLFCLLLTGCAWAMSSITFTGSSSLAGLFFYFLRLGSVLYGSGYVLFAFLEGDLVQKLHWLSQSQLFDAIAIGQVTPGPLFTSATFIGYLLYGFAGAGLATVAIFLPAFLFVRFTGPLVKSLRGSKIASAFLDSINLASLALMIAVALKLAIAIYSPLSAVFTALSLILLLRFKINSAWLILTAVLLGALLS